MVRRTAVALLALSLLFAGCASAPDDDGTNDEGPAAPAAAASLVSVLDSEGCDYNDLIWLMPVAQAQALLPDAFVAREIFADGIGAVVINAFDCGGAFAWNGWDMFALVLPPSMPEVVEAFDAANRTPRGTGEHYELDLYSLAAHTDHEGLRAVFEVAGIPVGPGASSKTAVANEPVPAASAVVTLTAGGQRRGTAVLQGLEAADTLGGRLTAHHRQWHVTDNGTWLVERVMTNAGAPIHLTQGPGACTLDPSTSFFAVVGARSCTLSQDAIGGMEWAGRAYLFPGVVPLAP